MSIDPEILSDIEALKERFGDTKALYREVCSLLFFRYGITPTTNKLYQFVRKGTMSTPAEALARFWEELRGKARIEIDHPGLPEPIKAVAAEAIAAVWREATEAARGELGALRVELQAEQERLQHEVGQMQQSRDQAHAVAAQLRAELASASEVAASLRADLEAERRAHAGAVARGHELQGQVEQALAHQQRQQDGFSADLAKARDAVEAADRRSSSAERRALLEIDQERQARAKAEKQAESARAQVAEAQARHLQVSLEHAETVGRLQAQCDAAVAAEDAQRRARDADAQALRDVRTQLLSSEQEAVRHQAEAQALKGLLERVTLQAPQAARAARKKTSVP